MVFQSASGVSGCTRVLGPVILETSWVQGGLPGELRPPLGQVRIRGVRRRSLEVVPGLAIAEPSIRSWLGALAMAFLVVAPIKRLRELRLGKQFDPPSTIRG